MLKVEVQYVDFGNIEALPLASLREPTRAISHVNSLPFQVLHPTCLYVPCSPSPDRYSTPLAFCCLPTCHSLSFKVPHPHVLLCLSLAALFPDGYPSLFVLTPRSLFLQVPHSTCCVPFPPCSLPLQVPLPNSLFVSHLTVFPLRYPTLMPFCVPPLLLSSRTSTPPYLSFCFPPLTLSPERYPLHLSHCVRVRPFSPLPCLSLFPHRYPSLTYLLFPTSLSSLSGTPPTRLLVFPLALFPSSSFSSNFPFYISASPLSLLQ